MRLPNFFVAGVPKAGTTSLYHYLRQHPQVYLSSIKEPGFFGAADLLSSPDGDRIRRRLEWERAALRRYLAGPQDREAGYLVVDWQDYLKLFRGVQDETAIGEASVTYVQMPGAAPAIHARVPEARLLFVLRDPAERLFSLYLAGRWQEPRLSLRARFERRVDEPDGWSGDSWSRAIGAGRYATHLGRFFEAFPRDRIRVYLYEDYAADPGAVLRDIFAFLGVAPDHDIDTSLRHNETLVPRLPRVHALRRGLLGATSALRWLPEGARSVVRGLYHRRASDIAMDPSDRRALVAYYRAEIERTADLIGRDLAAWLR